METAETKEEFNSSMIKTPRIIFSPGSALRQARKETKFEKQILIPSGGNFDNKNDRPVIE